MIKPLFFLLLLAAGSFAQAQEIVLNGTLSKSAIVTINGKHQVLRLDKRNPDGVLLLEVGKGNAVFDVNGERVELEIDKNYVANNNIVTPKAIVRIPSSAGGHYRVSGKINGHTVNFMVDTGATIIAMNLQVAKRLGINYRAGERVSITTANGDAVAYLVTLNRVSVGAVEVKNVKATVSIGDFPRDILLGNSYLSRVDMRRESGVLILEAMY